MTIPTLPTSPSRTMGQDTFDATVDAFLAALPATVTAMNTDIAVVNSQYSATVTNTAAAAASATAAAASATSANSAAGAAVWVSGTYATGVTAWSPSNYRTYRTKTTGSKTVDPANDPTNWEPVFENLPVVTNPKQLAQAIHVTYAASGSSGFQQAHNSAIHDVGTGNFGYHGMKFALADYTPTADVHFLYKHDGTNGVIWGIRATTGKMFLTINATTYESTVAAGTEDGTAVEPAVMVQRETATAAGIIRFAANGVQVGADVAITAGTPVTVNNTATCYLMGTSTKREACTLYSLGGFYNCALSVAEVRSRYLNGVAYAHKGAATTERAVNGTFTGSATGWTLGAGWAYGTNNIVATGATGYVTQTYAGFVEAKRFRASVTVSNYVSGSFRLNLGGTTPDATIAGNGTWTFDRVLLPGTGPTFYLQLLSAFTGTIDDISFGELGATSDLSSIQPNQIHDTGASDGHAAFPGAGTTLAQFKETGQYNWTTAIAGDTTLTNIVPAGYELEKILFKNSTAGAVSVRLGTTAGGTDLFGLTALNTSATFGGYKTVLVNQGFSATAAQTLYLSSTDWTGGGTPPSLVFTMYFRRIS